MEDMHGSGGDVKPLPESTGIEILREKLHAKMALLRSRGRPVDREAGDKEDLLEERRRQRAAMRERRRKETREKIRREEEMKAKSSKNKQRDKSQPTNVRVTHICVSHSPRLKRFATDPATSCQSTFTIRMSSSRPHRCCVLFHCRTFQDGTALEDHC